MKGHDTLILDGGYRLESGTQADRSKMHKSAPTWGYNTLTVTLTVLRGVQLMSMRSTAMESSDAGGMSRISGDLGRARSRSVETVGRSVGFRSCLHCSNIPGARVI